MDRLIKSEQMNFCAGAAGNTPGLGPKEPKCLGVDG
jgi:hypothetical protein